MVLTEEFHTKITVAGNVGCRRIGPTPSRPERTELWPPPTCEPSPDISAARDNLSRLEITWSVETTRGGVEMTWSLEITRGGLEMSC